MLNHYSGVIYWVFFDQSKKYVPSKEDSFYAYIRPSFL